MNGSVGWFGQSPPAGYQAIEGAAPLHVEHVRQLFIGALTKDELDALTRISSRIVAHLEAHPD
ncbi:hypothetical protein [Streptomyces parvus]|uniref:hypothetical protein n=1 Tax=Streptomyces parvus TaxID=66428 RepID=UPI003F4E696D